MLVIKTSRVSTVKNIFCLAVALIALFSFGVKPVYEWAASAARSESRAARPAAATTPASATANKS